MTTTDVKASQKLPLMTLTAMVVGSMVGAGVFSLPRNFGHATGVFGAAIAWLIAGVGMLVLAFVFGMLAVREPELDAGVYAYAKAGFGEFPGSFSAFGYWASACVGNVSYWVLIKSTLGVAVPGFGEGNTLLAVGVSAVGVWAFHLMILRGVTEAAAINRIVTIAELVPILVFVVAIAVVHTAFLVIAAGPEFLLLSFIIYAPGTVLFAVARREQHRRVFSPAELVLFVVAVVLAVLGTAGLATGPITI